jgi:release factor glutamine methyltransferase
MPQTLSTLLTDAAVALADASPAPRLDAELLLAHALGRERSYLHAHAGEALDSVALERFQKLTAARQRGEPIAYLTSKREFWSLELKVSPATLIPRHETELLVELALERIPESVEWDLLDLGTGSGAIALALARERPRCRVTATDLSASALAVAKENAVGLQTGNVGFIAGDWFMPLAGRCFHLIVSNPPYIREHDPHLAQGDVRFEPRTALTAGPDGLDDLRRIVAAAPAHLENGGWLLLEHGRDQGAEVREMLITHGYTSAATFRDLQGLERVSGAMRTDAAAPR